MPSTFKETLKFSLLALSCLGIVLAACLVARPYALGMDETRRAEVVRHLVPGNASAPAITVKDGADSVLVYHPSKKVAVVFMPVHLLMGDLDLALQVENDKVVRMVDLNPGLPPFYPGLRNFLGDASEGRPDAVGGATHDYARLAALLDRATSLVRKAGGK